MSYLESVPRRMVTLYLPLSIIVIVLLFPFYWMALTAIKPDEQLLDLDTYNPFWTWNPTFKHIHKLLFESYYPLWLWNTMYVAIASTILSIIASVLAAYAIVRLRYRGAQWVGGADLPVLSGAAVDPVHSARDRRVPVRAVRHPDRADPDLSDHPDPVLDLAADGLLQDHPVRAGRVRADRRRQPLADPDQDRAAAGDPGADLGVHLLLHAVLERVHLCADLPAPRSQNKTVPVAIVNEFVDGDIYRWGSLMAGALAGSLPLVILYAFFVEHYVSAMTGAVKE